MLGVWDGVGALQVGQHTGQAVEEWNVHAWDLAKVNGQERRPSDAEIVATGRLVLPEPLPAGDRWTATLRWAGRNPDSCRQFSGVFVPQADPLRDSRSAGTAQRATIGQRLSTAARGRPMKANGRRAPETARYQRYLRCGDGLAPEPERRIPVSPVRARTER